MTTTRPIIPSVTEATRRVDAADDIVSTNEEILAVAEDFAHYVAARSRDITVATPARRRLREEIERVVLAFVRTAEPPAALDKRAEARVLEIIRQALETREVRIEGLSEEQRQIAIDSASSDDRRLEPQYPRDAIDAG